MKPLAILSLLALSFSYPNLEKGSIVEDYHGTKVADPYRVLEETSHPQTLDWLKEQNALTESYFDKLTHLDSTRDLVTLFLDIDERTPPKIKGNRAFFFEKRAKASQRSLVMMEGDEIITLLDPTQLDETGQVHISAFKPSLDGNLVAIAIAKSGSDWRDIWIVDTATKKRIDEPITGVKFSDLAWDKEGLYVSKFDQPTGNPLEAANQGQYLSYHKIGTHPKEDTLVFLDPHTPKHLFQGETHTKGRYLVLKRIGAGNYHNCALYIKDLTKGEEPFTPLIGDFESANGVVTIENGIAYVITDRNAPQRRLVAIDIDNPNLWKEIIPEKGEKLDDISQCGDTFVALYEKEAHHELTLLTKEGTFIKKISLPGMGRVGQITPQGDKGDFTFTFTNFTTPTTVLSYSQAKGELSPLFAPDLPFNPNHFVCEQRFFKSGDGTRVPLFLVKRRDLKEGKPAPTLLSGYGGFGISRLPYYNALNIAFVQKGGVLAIPGIRGGGEYGEAWHKAGSLRNKQNSFDDFIACALYLMKEGITTKEQLATMGGSNGGLLVAATMLQRPDLFRAVVPTVAVLDMLRFQHFTIGHRWILEYGSPDNLDDFKVLMDYSPLHNVKRGMPYPSTLIVTADHDDRVVPAHSYKFAATLQELNGSSNPILLRVEKGTGHQLISKSRAQLIEEKGAQLAFIWNELTESSESASVNLP